MAHETKEETFAKRQKDYKDAKSKAFKEAQREAKALKDEKEETPKDKKVAKEPEYVI